MLPALQCFFLISLWVSPIRGFVLINPHKPVFPCSYTCTNGDACNRSNSPSSSTRMNLLWFGGSDEKKKASKAKREEKKTDKSKQFSSKMGATATTMENFKQSQELGKKTNTLLQDLSSTTVEGSAAKGKIKVTVDGQQRPMGVEIDDDYFDTCRVEDLTEALAVAMQDAHEKSTKIMQDRMTGLYVELGLPSNTKS